MKKSLFILSAFICLVIFNCKNKENPEPETEPNYASIDVVTGLDLFDENGSPIGRWKFPNQKPGNGSTFPNPSTGIVSIYNTQKIERVWLIPAICVSDSTTMDIPGLSEDLNYEIAELENAQIKDISVPIFNNQISLDFSDVPKGFYRIFYQIETKELFWQNLFIDPSATNIPSYEALDEHCDQ